MIMKRFAIVNAKRNRGAFTLIELIISMVILTLLILLATQVVNTTATITRPANKRIDTDTQARGVLDRMALDFGRMLKRTDVDYYIKQPIKYNGHGNGHGYGKKLQTGQQGSDQIAFFGQVPGYYPAGAQSPLSLIGYRINENSNSASYLKLERMGKGLLWNGVNTNLNQPPNSSQFTSPIVFLPLLITDRWPNATSGTTANADYEVLGDQVFRFEYYYLLKNGRVTDVPWDKDARLTQQTLATPTSIGLVDVQAIAVAIAVIDPASRSLLYDPSTPGDPWHRLFSIGEDMDDFKTAPGRGVGGAKKIGDLEVQWNTAVQSAASSSRTSDGSSFPPAAASGIRIYNRYFDLRTF